jgi:type IV secretion system protein VirB9
MKITTPISLLALSALALGAAAIAQEPMAPAQTPEQRAATLQAFQEPTSTANETVVPPPSVAAGPAPPTVLTATPPTVRSPSGRQYTLADKRRLEAELREVNSSLKIREVTDTNTQHASDAIAVRGQILFTYVDGGIYEVQAATLRQTAIVLQPGEVLTGRDLPTAGDTARWILAITRTGVAPNERIVLIIKPIDSGLETNMTITTNRRIYNIVLKSTERTYMPLVGWSYPQDEARSIEVESQKVEDVQAQTEPLAVDPARLNFSCTVSGTEVVWKPLRVYDDGVKTYLQMNPEMASYEAPAMFVLENKQPLLVNYRVKKSVYIVDRLFERGQLRVGPKNAVDIQCSRKLTRAG